MSNANSDDDGIEQPATPGVRLTARLLDEQAAAEEFAGLDRIERRRVADVQWLHSLLQQVFQRDAAACERRISRACEAIRNEAARTIQPAATATKRRPVWLVTSLVAAVLVVAAVFIHGNFNPPQSALAAVESTLKHAQTNEDRLYRVDTQWQLLGGGEPLDLVGDLWVRGNAHYLLRQDTPLGTLYVGSNGREHWLAPSLGPILVGETGRFERMVLGRPVATPFLQITTMLEHFANRYELTLGPEEELPAVRGQSTVRCTHVTGRRRDAHDVLSPEVIDLWTARQSGIAYRIQARWTAGQAGARQLQLQLLPLAAPLAEHWYDHESHHAPDRPILRDRGEEHTL